MGYQLILVMDKETTKKNSHCVWREFSHHFKDIGKKPWTDWLIHLHILST